MTHSLEISRARSCSLGTFSFYIPVGDSVANPSATIQQGSPILPPSSKIFLTLLYALTFMVIMPLKTVLSKLFKLSLKLSSESFQPSASCSIPKPLLHFYYGNISLLVLKSGVIIFCHIKNYPQTSQFKKTFFFFFLIVYKGQGSRNSLV